jgi:hypothetical protein
MNPKLTKPIPFLMEQQDLAALFETDEVAQYFRNESVEPKKESLARPVDVRKKAE